MTQELKIAITGTFFTNKALITHALTLLTKMPKVSPLPHKDLMDKYFPGQSFECLTLYDHFQLEIYKIFELVLQEQNIQGGFWSDGELLQPYIGGLLNIILFNNYLFPKQKKPFVRVLQQSKLIFHQKKIKALNYIYKNMLRSHLETNYHSVIHFPVESTTHNSSVPGRLNQAFVAQDKLMIGLLEELSINYYIITGTSPIKLEKIMKIYDLNPVIPIEVAINQARESLKNRPNPFIFPF